jgi:hypothetical protein
LILRAAPRDCPVIGKPNHTVVMPCRCTGTAFCAILENAMRRRMRRCGTGDHVRVDDRAELIRVYIEQRPDGLSRRRCYELAKSLEFPTDPGSAGWGTDGFGLASVRDGEHTKANERELVIHVNSVTPAFDAYQRKIYEARVKRAEIARATRRTIPLDVRRRP